MKPRRVNVSHVFRCSVLTTPSLSRFGVDDPEFAAAIGIAEHANLLIAAQEATAAIWGAKDKGPSRYSRGAYSVLYTAATPTVAVAERSHWAIELVFRAGRFPPIRGFTIFTCDIHDEGRSYMRGWAANKMLVHPDDYDLCQQIGADEWDGGTNYLVVPSARKLRGRCVPVLKPHCAKVRDIQAEFVLEWDQEQQAAFRTIRGRKYYVKIDPVYELC